MNWNKVKRLDGVPAELLKKLRERYRVCKLSNMNEKMYRDGNISEDFAKSKTVRIPNKGNSTERKSYRTISLLTHAPKVLLIIMKNRIKKKIEEELDEDKFCFRQRIIDTSWESILPLRILTEKRLNVNRNTFITFSYVEKAFDTVFLLMNSMKKKHEKIGRIKKL